MDLNHHPQEHHRPDSLSYPSLLASSGLGVWVPCWNAEICRQMKRLRRSAKVRTKPISGRTGSSARPSTQDAWFQRCCC